MPLRIENGGICSVLLIEMIAKLREVRKLHSMPSEASQSHKKLLPESDMALLRAYDKFKARQPPVAEVDEQFAQGAAPQMTASSIVVPSAGVFKRPNICAVMYHSCCIRT